MAQPPSSGAVAYVDLHETVIASATPYGQLGIEYEIEMLSLTFGAPFMKNVLDKCGSERVEGLTFIKEHVEVDVGHTEFNRRQLIQVLGEHPEFSAPLGEAGAKALEAYRQFMTDCLDAIR